MSILARTRPYPTRVPNTYICKRCGIQRTTHAKNKPAHCIDCRPYTRGGKQ